ncbi:MAG TPA: NAD(P)-dependent oxidoreductase [Mycobacteriales bacterium]|nr:NAD(P)-dependent oxidoreductase [Mycobacteriales bacterium]
MPVVVTGAAGFIGTALVAELTCHGIAVVAVDREPMPHLPAGAVPLRADLLDADPTVPAALAAADAVFHLAGRAGVRGSGPAAERGRHRDNVLATSVVLDLVPPRTPLVITSSSSVYGGSRGWPCTETDPLRPVGGYARSKAAVESLAAGRLAVGGAVAVARPFTVVGERQRPDMALALWAAAARRGDPIRIHGSAARTRDLTDVRDAARALRLVAERGLLGPVNVGTGRPHTLAALADAVRAATGVDVPLQVVPAAAEEPADTWADPTLLARRCGLRPYTDLADVVRRAVAPAAAPAMVTA